MDVDFLIKTGLGFERIVASRVKEIDGDAVVIPSPMGFKGLVLVKAGGLSRDELYRRILGEVVEADKVIPVYRVVKAELGEIAREAAELARGMIGAEESFAVRTTRRGRHGFTSIDVNVVVGDAVRKATGASVNLRYPDKIVLVEIIGDKALLSIVPGGFEWHKYAPGKKPLYRLFERIAVIQMPYLGPRESIEAMGKRIGREVQNFEVRELVISPIGLVDAEQLMLFIDSVLEGIRSRYMVQRKGYSRKPRRVPVYVMDLHQLVRDRAGEPIVVFEPEGKYIGDVAGKLAQLVLGSRKRVNLLFGSREGIPLGVYRYADLVVDIAPGITLSTDYAAAAGLIALATVIYNWLESDESSSTSSR